MSRIGADVDQLDALARLLGGRSADLIGSDRTLTTALAHVTWQGPDADSFRTAWEHEHSPVLRRVGRILDDLGADVRDQAAAQRTTSTDGAGATAPAGTGAPRIPADLDGNGTVDDLEQEWYDLHESGEQIGPPQLHLDEGGLVPQGLGHDPTRGQILTSYYDDDGVVLSIQDQDSGVEVGDVRLGGDPDDPDAGDPNKGGGVATDGTYVWLADGGEVFVYRRADIDAAAPGETVPAIGVEQTAASSWITIDDGQVYVGDFKNPDYLFSYQGDPKAYRYDVDPATGALVNPTEGQDIPYSVQGATVTDDGIFFSRSFSDQPIVSPHDLTFQEFDGDLAGFDLEPVDDVAAVYDLPYFSEGIVQIDGDVWVLSEGGADKFGGAGERWIQIVPSADLGDLDGDDGVGPEIEIPDFGGIDIPDVPGVDVPDIPPVDPPGPIPGLPGIPTPDLPGIPTPDIPGFPIPDLPVPLPDDLPDVVTGIPDAAGDIKDGISSGLDRIGL